MARPSSYKDEYAEQARKLCRLGLIDKEIAEFFGVSEQTINAWKLKSEEFLEALKDGKTFADAQVADKLFHRATGYSHPDVDIRVIDGQIVQTPLVKHYAPDTTACIFWLKNRDKARWRDKLETEHSGNVNYTNLSDDELENKIRQLGITKP